MSAARLSALDAAFLSLESAEAPMHVGWAAAFAPPAGRSRPRYEDVLAHIESRLGRAPRYRQKLASVPLGLGDPVWVDDPGFDIADHVLRASHGDFGALVDEVMSAPLEHDRPLWELWIAERLDDGMIGVVGKAHHCLVDGLAAVELMALLLDPSPDVPGAGDDGTRAVNGWRPRRRPSAMALAGGALSDRLGDARRLATLPAAWARSPATLADGAWRAAKAVVQAAVHVAMRSRKQAGVPEGADAVLGALALAPRPVRRVASRVIASPGLSNLTISNIPGPQLPLYLLGCEVKHAYPVVPLTDRHRLSIGMTSIHERACFGVYAHGELAAEADRVAASLGSEIDELLARAAA